MIYQSLILFVEVSHSMNKGDLSGPQKKSCCCSSGWKMLQNISKEFRLHKSTVRQLVYKWRKFNTVVIIPKSGWSIKITPKAKHAIVHEVAKEPMVTSKQLKASLSHWLMLMFMSPPPEEHWTSMVCMAELQGERHCFPKRTLLPIYSSLKFMWTSQMAIGEMF